HPNIKIINLPSAGVLPNGRIQKIWLMCTYIFFAAIKSLVAPSVDINIFLSQPPLFALWGWFLKNLRGQHFMMLLMDIYPHIAVNYGVLRENGKSVRVLTKLAELTWRQADELIVIGRCMKDVLISANVPTHKINFIPNWVNEQEIFPVSHKNNLLRHELNLDNKFVVLYSGNMGVSHEFSTILQAAELLINENNIIFVFIGTGSKRPYLELKKKQKNLHNLILLPMQPQKRLSESLSLGDVHLVTLREGFEGLAVPSKAYGAIAVERPIIYIGHSDGEIARMINEEQVGVVISPGDGERLANAVLSYVRDNVEYTKQSKNAYELFKRSYTRENALNSYSKLFRRYAMGTP
ncbi:MAG: glycosyltransferase family 4 protein, partial [Paludibacter sp.]